MKSLKYLIVSLCLNIFTQITAQSTFDTEEYALFLEQNENLSASALLERFRPEQLYFKGLQNSAHPDDFEYFDSVKIKLKLTKDELKLLEQNHFVVTERHTDNSFGSAFHNIYIDDLPVMVTSDAILHALHVSYDQILIDVELAILKPNLIDLLNGLYDTFPQLVEKYKDEPQLNTALQDVDLFVTIALSLLLEQKGTAQLTDQQKVDQMWTAVLNETLSKMPLFSERLRELDFSQFTVRGHYNNDELRSYFKSMMWLGRMDFFLTPPPKNPWEFPWTREEIRRMNLGAYLLNELVGLADVRDLLEQNDEIITFMIGESDNLTPKEHNQVLSDLAITNATDLLNDTIYDLYLIELDSRMEAGQKILSSIMMMDPYDQEPGKLPVSFRLLGQRFIIDSYVFSNVVYDRVVFEGKKIFRPLPDPLDVMFVLGNDNALQLLKEELSTYKYASQLASLRYLVDSYDPDFWDLSLYNVWLQAIRGLNPSLDRTGYPLFMKTAAWQQQKMNTQLASWAQLRHDNLLYAKQSYTGGTGCSFPHSYIEPYPQLYRSIETFAEKAENYFAAYGSSNENLAKLNAFFPRLRQIMQQLTVLAEKEIAGQSFSVAEAEFLKKMIFADGMSGRPPYDGWYADLFYIKEDAGMPDFVIADVHTQPTEENGARIGRVLHVGVGQINLGIFLAAAPADGYKPMAFVGPVMSYYEKLTEQFDRLTDERWEAMVWNRELPQRKDWTNIYLADENGNMRTPGREIKSEVYTGQEEPVIPLPEQFVLLQNYPNPFNPQTTIVYNLPRQDKVNLSIYNMLGQKIAQLVDEKQSAGQHTIIWQPGNLPSGVYICKIVAGAHQRSIKIVFLK